MATKEYRHGSVVVGYDADVCVHAAECVRGLPKVFDPEARPWIRPDQASPEDLEAVIRKCPSGALTFRKEPTIMTNPSAPSPSQTPPASVKVTVMRNGPLIVEGPCTVSNVEGQVLREATRVALCRCGGSAKKPFCDGTHSRAGFAAD